MAINLRMFIFSSSDINIHVNPVKSVMLALISDQG